MQHMMSIGQDISQTRRGTTTVTSDDRCFLETHCTLQERQHTATSRAGQSVSDGRTLGMCRLWSCSRLSVAYHSSFPGTTATAVSRDHVV